MHAAAGSPYCAADPAVVAQQMIGSVPMHRYGGIEEIPGAVAFLLGDGWMHCGHSKTTVHYYKRAERGGA